VDTALTPPFGQRRALHISEGAAQPSHGTFMAGVTSAL
jgi:hypothetical protein